MRIVILLLIATAFCSACREQPEYLRTMTEEQIIEMARREPLERRYQIHKEVFQSDVPPPEYVIPVVVEDAKQAYALALREATSGTYDDIRAAIVVIGHISRKQQSKCPEEDLRRILANLEKVSPGTEPDFIVADMVRVDCGFESILFPPKVRS